MDDSDELMIFRVGTFFYVISAAAFLLFVVSDFAEQADFDYLFMSLLLAFVGWILRRSKPPPPSADRFAWLRRIQEERRRRKNSGRQNKKR